MSFPSLNSESVTSGKLLTQYFYPEKKKRTVCFCSSLLVLYRFRSYLCTKILTQVVAKSLWWSHLVSRPYSQKKKFLYRWTDLTYAKCLKRLKAMLKASCSTLKNKACRGIVKWKPAKDNFFFLTSDRSSIDLWYIYCDSTSYSWHADRVLTKSYKKRLNFCERCYNKEINRPYWNPITVVFF